MDGLDEEFSARLREAMGDESVSSFARRCDIPEASMRGYVKGRIPSADKALRLADEAHVSFEWLVSGRGDKRSVKTVPSPTHDVDKNKTEIIRFDVSDNHSEFSLVSRLDVQASAGNGSVGASEEQMEQLAFQSSWLRSRGINPVNARILSVRGDSMEETIRDGDILLVDTSIDRIKDNSIYVLVYGEMVLVKRVHARLNGSLQLISDNPRYPPEEVSAGEVDLLKIAGRVMWFGRTI